MKKYKFYIGFLIVASLFVLESCGPVIISSRSDTPPPPWFYPNRVEMVRYVYFPDYMIYYDLSLRNYRYLDNGMWITVSVLPPRYNNINLRRSRYVRIRDYYGDNIRSYHRDNRSRYNRSRTTRSRSTTTRNRGTRTNNTTRSRSTRSRDTTRVY
ncbi:hypothetical protein [uncultured Aquimarina sp.]|uniref:hypothetical protein n=1 Tax=uncultured Aquimarina sp. TaxID=575652 RepID=UPI00260FAECE|nr:hypothetical protein [uncultured Aquimarina sp.]